MFPDRLLGIRSAQIAAVRLSPKDRITPCYVARIILKCNGREDWTDATVPMAVGVAYISLSEPRAGFIS
jgi:hypothetical protein